ncbi:hypothetical protein [Flavobacterium sp.]|nr:hypothetical protein [Flavobacterium sp.]
MRIEFFDSNADNILTITDINSFCFSGGEIHIKVPIVDDIGHCDYNINR